LIIPGFLKKGIIFIAEFGFVPQKIEKIFWGILGSLR